MVKIACLFVLMKNWITNLSIQDNIDATLRQFLEQDFDLGLGTSLLLPFFI